MLILSDHEVLLNIQYVAYLPINQIMVTKDINQMSVLIATTTAITTLHLTITVHAVLTQFPTHS
jgi:hypothetical protein